MKLISWNVNGLRACVQKGFLDRFSELDADFFCLQETKLQEGQIDLNLPGYQQYWCYAEKKGYSGTAIFTKHTPMAVTTGIGVPELDTEGRVLTLEYPEFFLVNCYTPNAQRGLARLDHRMQWDKAFRCYLSQLDQKKPVILCGDLNVAHQEIDLKNPKSNRGNAGFSDEERESFTKTLDAGFTDTFRYLHPDQTEAYTWWSYMFNARQNNAGWRIDYFLVSKRIQECVYKTPIYSDILGSDHCPVGLELDILCNGSIWPSEAYKSPAQQGIDQQPQNPVVKTTSVFIALIALLYGLWSLPKPNSELPADIYTQQALTTTPTANIALNHNFGYIYRPAESFQFQVFSTPIIQIMMDSSSPISSQIIKLIPYFSDGSTVWQQGNVVQTGASASDATYWIRIEMSDELKANYDGSWYPSAFVFSFSSSFTNTNTEGFTVQEYCSEDGSVAGWFVYGVLSDNEVLSVSNSLTGDSICMYSVSDIELISQETADAVS